MNTKIESVPEALAGIKKQSILGSWISRALNSQSPAQAMVHPCLIDGQHTLVYERDLQARDPEAYQQIIEFAELNGFETKEDRRADFLDGVKRVKNKRHANVITIMALTTTLLSTSVAASSADDIVDDSYEVTQPYSANGIDLDFSKNMSEEELIAGLLGWINEHSSFKHDISSMPALSRVSAVDMAHVAFGEKLPAAINPEKLEIYGLYNFNEEKVYLLDTLDLQSEKGRGVLLHELVHFLQYKYDKDDNVQCVNELESLAYILEAQYLQAHDHEHKISLKHINKVSQCNTA